MQRQSKAAAQGRSRAMAVEGVIVQSVEEAPAHLIDPRVRYGDSDSLDAGVDPVSPDSRRLGLSTETDELAR